MTFGGGGGGTAPWLTVNVSPAIVSVPPRAAPELAATLNATDPLPVPAAPEDTSMNGELLVAVHWQSNPWVTVTAIVPVPPLASKDWLVGLSPNVQAAADWEIVRLNWLMVTVPERCAPELAWTLSVTVPLPRPVVGAMVMKADPLPAVQLHAAPVMTSSVRDPPAAGTAAFTGSAGTLSGQVSTERDDGAVTVVTDTDDEPLPQPIASAASRSHRRHVRFDVR